MLEVVIALKNISEPSIVAYTPAALAFQEAEAGAPLKKQELKASLGITKLFQQHQNTLLEIMFQRENELHAHLSGTLPTNLPSWYSNGDSVAGLGTGERGSLAYLSQQF